MANKTNYDDVYSRAQTSLNTESMSSENLLNWLTGGDIVKEKSLDVRLLASRMESDAIQELQPLIDYAESPTEIKSIENIEIESLYVDIEERKMAVTEGLADRIRNPINIVDYENAVEDLRQISPQKLGGLKTADIMKGRRALQMF